MSYKLYIQDVMMIYDDLPPGVRQIAARYGVDIFHLRELVDDGYSVEDILSEIADQIKE